MDEISKQRLDQFDKRHTVENRRIDLIEAKKKNDKNLPSRVALKCFWVGRYLLRNPKYQFITFRKR